MNDTATKMTAEELDKLPRYTVGVERCTMDRDDYEGDYFKRADVLALIAQARAAAPVITAEKVETEMAERLRRIVVNIGEGPITVTSKLLTQAADECDRFYNGMMNWKATAQAKDRTIVELRAAAPVSERAEDARDELRERVLEMWANFERMGEVCSFEGNSMIYASTLEELAAMAATNATKEGA